MGQTTNIMFSAYVGRDIGERFILLQKLLGIENFYAGFLHVGGSPKSERLTQDELQEPWVKAGGGRKVLLWPKGHMSPRVNQCLEELEPEERTALPEHFYGDTSIHIGRICWTGLNRQGGKVKGPKANLAVSIFCQDTPPDGERFEEMVNRSAAFRRLAEDLLPALGGADINFVYTW